jgi:hypothetical protein
VACLHWSFAFANRRVSNSFNPRNVAALLALMGIVAVYTVPNLKYSANPPAVGRPYTVGIHTQLYFTMMALLIAAAAYVVAVAVVAALLPPINEVPADFPAVVLWHSGSISSRCRSSSCERPWSSSSVL